MHISVCLLMITAVAGALRADGPAVEVFVPNIPDSRLDVPFLTARATVTKIYSEMGIRVIWRSAASRPRACVKAPLHRNIVVVFASASRQQVSDMALAYANPFETEGPCVTVLIDRVTELVRRNPQSTGYLLGHVLAHEMGHVLQEVARHSGAGVMKARWSTEEIRQMPSNPLPFLPSDTELILRNLGVRQSVQAAVGENPVDEQAPALHALAR
jgi:hypothetical protein